MSLSCLLGYIPDDEDKRDLEFETIKHRFSLENVFFSTTKISSHHSSIQIPVWRTPRMQVGNSCVANAWCMALEILSDHNPTGPRLPKLSAQHLYWCARHYDGGAHLDQGTRLRSAAKTLWTLGVCSSTDCPDDSERLLVQPNASSFMRAYDARIHGYYRIDASNLDDAELAITACHPVVMGVPVGSEFISYAAPSKDALDVALSPPTTTLGYHALCVVGVRFKDGERQWKIVNSWGDKWGDYGFAWLTESYLSLAKDMWVATQSPY